MRERFVIFEKGKDFVKQPLNTARRLGAGVAGLGFGIAFGGINLVPVEVAGAGFTVGMLLVGIELAERSYVNGGGHKHEHIE